MDFDTIRAHMIVQTAFNEDAVVTFVLATVNDDDGNERVLVVMEADGNSTVLFKYEPEVPFNVAASAFWTQTQGEVVDASDQAYLAVFGDPADSNSNGIIIPDTDTVVSINQEKN